MMSERTLAEARLDLGEALGEGVFCPCCGQYAKEYKRKLNSRMARSIIWLVRRFRETTDWVDVARTAPRFVVAGGGEMAKLAHWGLIEQRMNTDEKKRTSGVWRPTQRGIDFVQERCSVPSHVYLYNNEVRGWAGTKTDIRAALGKRFDYAELMGWKG
jgi:hypothetical protein